MDKILKKTNERWALFAACLKNFKFSGDVIERSALLLQSIREKKECVPYYMYHDRIECYCYMISKKIVTPIDVVKYERDFGIDGNKTMQYHYEYYGSCVGTGIAESFYVQHMFSHNDGEEAEPLLYLARCACMFMRVNLEAKEYNKIVQKCRAK